MTRIRIALADDHPVVRAGMRALIREAPDMELVGEAADGLSALKLIQETIPDVAVVDVSMPGMSGLKLIRRAAEENSPTRFLLLTMHEDRAYVQQMLEAGGCGYLLKRSATEELVRAVQVVFNGGLYLDPAIADALRSPAAAVADGPARGGALSERELEVLKLTARGFSNKEIAARLALGIKTVETYKARAAEKLKLRTRAEIVRYCAARGWLDDP